MSMALRWLLFLTAWAFAHEEAVRPVEVELKAEASAARVRVAVHPDFWFGPKPPKAESIAQWPEEFRLKAEKYLAAHLALALDGKGLEGRLVDCRYMHNPWQAPDEGRFVFALSYPLPFPGGRLLVRSSFHSKLAELSAHLRVSGRRSLDFVFTPDKPAFEMALAEASMSALQRTREAFSLGFSWTFSRAAAALFACVVVLVPPRRWRVGAVTFAALTAVLFFARVPFPVKTLEAASWAAVAWMGLAACLRLGWAWWAGLLAAAPVWASASSGAPAATLECASFLCGVFASAALLALTTAGLKARQAKRAEQKSESLAERMLASQLRFVATVFTGAGVLGLLKAVGG